MNEYNAGRNIRVANERKQTRIKLQKSASKVTLSPPAARAGTGWGVTMATRPKAKRTLSKPAAGPRDGLPWVSIETGEIPRIHRGKDQQQKRLIPNCMSYLWGTNGCNANHVHARFEAVQKTSAPSVLPSHVRQRPWNTKLSEALREQPEEPSGPWRLLNFQQSVYLSRH